MGQPFLAFLLQFGQPRNTAYRKRNTGPGPRGTSHQPRNFSVLYCRPFALQNVPALDTPGGRQPVT